jgi:hypothetical protein
VSVVFHPKESKEVTSLLFLKNNLTLVEKLVLRGRGGFGTFQFPKVRPF